MYNKISRLNEQWKEQESKKYEREKILTKQEKKQQRKKRDYKVGVRKKNK